MATRISVTVAVVRRAELSLKEWKARLNYEPTDNECYHYLTGFCNEAMRAHDESGG